MASGWRAFGGKGRVRFAVVTAITVAGLAGAYFGFFPSGSQDQILSMARTAEVSTAQAATPDAAAATSDYSLTLNDAQLKGVKVEEVKERLFGVTREAVGNIDFDQDESVQVFTPYPGRITKLWAKAGDDVKKGQVLFEIDSPDLASAEGPLIQNAGQLELTTKALKRAQELFAAKGAAKKDVEQAVSDHQTAEGNYNAARDAVRIFGKTDAEMDRIAQDAPGRLANAGAEPNGRASDGTQCGGGALCPTGQYSRAFYRLRHLDDVDVRERARGGHPVASGGEDVESKSRHFPIGSSREKSSISEPPSTPTRIASKSVRMSRTRSTSYGHRCSPPLSFVRVRA